MAGAGSTSVLVFDESAVPSLFVGSGSGVSAVEETRLRRVPLDGAVPVTVSSTDSPLARSPRSHVTVLPETTPGAEAVTAVRVGGSVSVTRRRGRLGPLFVTVIVNSSWPPAATVGGADLVVITSALGRGTTPLQFGAGYVAGGSARTAPATTFCTVPDCTSKIWGGAGGVRSSTTIGSSGEDPTNWFWVWLVVLTT